MFFKKSGGKVLDMRFNSAERKAMMAEIQKQTAEYDRKNADEIDAIVLWVLHEVFGFGPTRLKRFHDAFMPELHELLRRYEMEEGDQVWLCTHMLNEYLATHGTSLEEWRGEESVDS